jgi:GNAT superfamily N-acetyltransferase
MTTNPFDDLQNRGMLTWSRASRDDLPELTALIDAIDYLDRAVTAQGVIDIDALFKASSDITMTCVIGRDKNQSALAWGLVVADDREKNPRQVWIYGGVHPGARHLGVGTSLMTWEIDQARYWYNKNLTHDHGPLKIIAQADSRRREAISLYQNNHFAPEIWYVDLQRRLDNWHELPVVPDKSVTITEMTKSQYNADIPKIYNTVFHDRMTAGETHPGGLAIATQTDDISYDLSRIACVNGQAVGYVLNSIFDTPNGLVGWSQQLAVLPAYRNLGIGRGMLVSSLNAFGAAGVTEAAIGVNSHSPEPILGLYTSLGYQIADALVLYTLIDLL